MKHILLLGALFLFGATASAQSCTGASGDKAKTECTKSKSSCCKGKADAGKSCCQAKSSSCTDSKGKKSKAKKSKGKASKAKAAKAQGVAAKAPEAVAAPAEVETGVCTRIEESIDGIENIVKVKTTAAEGACNVMVKLEINADRAKDLDDIKAQVNAITTFPANRDSNGTGFRLPSCFPDIRRLNTVGYRIS